MLTALGMLTLAALPAQGDRITCSDSQARITGDILAINTDGTVRIASPHSEKPLELLPGSIDRISFDHQKQNSSLPPAILTLSTGDRIPITPGSLQEGLFSATSPDFGPLKLPVTALASLRLGVRNESDIYSGPNKINEWTLSDPAAWEIRNKALISSGSSSAGLTLDLPDSFRLKFTLCWNESPNFTIHVADPFIDDAPSPDCYILNYNSNGITLIRQCSTGKEKRLMRTFNRRPDSFRDNRATFELLVDRPAARLTVLIDGESYGSLLDPTGSAPSGNGILFTSSAQDDVTQEYRSITAREYHHSSASPDSEARQHAEKDSIITRDDERLNGSLVSILQKGASSIVRFKSDFAPDPIDIVGDEVSTIFFAGPDDAEPAKSPFTLHLANGGSLRISSCIFQNNSLAATHPLLGTLTIDRDHISSISHGSP